MERVVRAVVLAGLLMAALAPSAGATLPGANGRLSAVVVDVGFPFDTNPGGNQISTVMEPNGADPASVEFFGTAGVLPLTAAPRWAPGGGRFVFAQPDFLL